MTALLWAPNIGLTYPFSSLVPARSSPDFIELDTNKDGAINGGDDPYGPFYPGDEYVDWVGLSLYWYTESNAFSPLNPMFQESIVGEGFLVNQITRPPNNPLRNFYEIFAKQKNKPMAIAETGAPVLYNENYAQGPTIEQELNMKREWWRQVWSDQVFARFPLIKLILNFEEAKVENRRFRDWRITWNETVLAAYKKDMQGDQGKHMIWSLDLTWNCGGIVKCLSESCRSKSSQ